MIYNTERALPASESLRTIAKEGTDGVIGEAGSVSDAVGQCDSLNVMMLPISPNDATCTVVVGNFESYQVGDGLCYIAGELAFDSLYSKLQINKWMRLPKFEGRKIKDRVLDHSLPLIHHPRVTISKGIDEFDLPDLYSNFKKKQKGFLFQHLDALRTWLENLDGILDELKELLEKRDVVRNNTVIVMTVNSGQSDLLGNFICQARSKGFDIGNVLVFSTDEETHKLVQGLGVASYYDHKNLGDMPKGEAKAYGDPVFARMMLAKVYCVLYVALLGHDVLFSDVDVVWLKNPLDFFHDESNTEIQKYDILAQHDGSAQPRYNPFSANSGFYYVRSVIVAEEDHFFMKPFAADTSMLRANKKSQYLFTSLIYDGYVENSPVVEISSVKWFSLHFLSHRALVRKTKSHQQVLVQLLLEHQSMFGLKVKVFDKILTKEFPGGFHYHQGENCFSFPDTCGANLTNHYLIRPYDRLGNYATDRVWQLACLHFPHELDRKQGGPFANAHLASNSAICACCTTNLTQPCVSSQGEQVEISAAARVLALE